MTQKLTGLDQVEDLYRNRGRRAKELHEAGRKVVGYFCCYPPIEMMTALGLVPYRIQGSVERPVVEADAYLETIMCSFMRSCFDLALTHDYDFLDGLIVPHTCDTVQRIYDIWIRYRRPQMAHFLNVPHMVQPSSYVFFKNELLMMQKALEELAGKKLEAPALREAIALHNENRKLLKQLYDLRKGERPRVKGSEVMKVIVAGMGLPVQEYSDLVRSVIDQAQARDVSPEIRPRVLITGSEIDDAAFLQLVEEAGADVVVDDLCTGTRSFWPEVPLTDDPLDGIVTRYLGGINCPRTYRAQMRPRSADLENRFGYMRRFAQDFHVEGVIFYIIRFCDTHELEAPDVIEYFSGQNIPVLHLEEEYRATNIGQIKTRLEAFVETLAV